MMMFNLSSRWCILVVVVVASSSAGAAAASWGAQQQPCFLGTTTYRHRQRRAFFPSSTTTSRSGASSSLTSSSKTIRQQQERNIISALAATAESSSSSIPPLLPPPSSASPHIILPGGGIFFYWQAGVLTYLRENGYVLSSSSSGTAKNNDDDDDRDDDDRDDDTRNNNNIVTFTGASAGALAATLAITGVDFYRATELALSMASDAGVWDRSQGLQGIWGPMIRDWLNELLPLAAAPPQKKQQQQQQQYIQDKHLSLLVTPLSFQPADLFGSGGRGGNGGGIIQKKRVDTFADRSDLIDANMASVHVPWFLDGKLTTTFRDHPWCIDGSFMATDRDYVPPEYHNHNHHLAPTTIPGNDPPRNNIITLDYTLDPKYKNKWLFDAVDAISPEGIYQILEDGKEYAKVLEEQGVFECLPRRSVLVR